MSRSMILPCIAGLLVAAALALPASAAQRVTLVIGNAAYSHGPRLANPLNDSNDISAALDRGQYRDGSKHGRGNVVWPDGRRYEGEWRQAKEHGKGAAAGTRYEGESRDGKRHGRGTYVFSDGGHYEGALAGWQAYVAQWQPLRG